MDLGTRPDDLILGEEADVLACLVRQRDACTALGIARATGLSTLAVVPALDRLLAAGSVSRRIDEAGDRPRLVYQLTVAGRREAARGRRPVRDAVPARSADRR